MPPWLSQLRSFHRKESKFDYSRWLQLATIGIDNKPRVRTVVFRGWSKSYEMEIFTDKRSQKYHELNLNNNLEICWLFPRSKCQFRLRGTSIMALDKYSLLHWEKLSEQSKLMWSWPTPGNHFSVEQTNNCSVTSNKELSNNFTVLKIDINHVDQLLLRKPVHVRKRWIRSNDWKEEIINP